MVFKDSVEKTTKTSTLEAREGGEQMQEMKGENNLGAGWVWKLMYSWCDSISGWVWKLMFSWCDSISGCGNSIRVP